MGTSANLEWISVMEPMIPNSHEPRLLCQAPLQWRLPLLLTPLLLPRLPQLSLLPSLQLNPRHLQWYHSLQHLLKRSSKLLKFCRNVLKDNQKSEIPQALLTQSLWLISRCPMMHWPMSMSMDMDIGADFWLDILNPSMVD